MATVAEIAAAEMTGTTATGMTVETAAVADQVPTKAGAVMKAGGGRARSP
jgi:hypothetical protein